MKLHNYKLILLFFLFLPYIKIEKGNLKIKTDMDGKNLVETFLKLHSNKKSPLYNINVIDTDDIISHLSYLVKRQSGGLSNDPNDPAFNDKPTKPYKDGKYYHTSYDITWTTFKSLSNKLNYIADPDLFYEMPDHIHYKIVNYIYDQVGQLSINNEYDEYYRHLAYFYIGWGAGIGRLKKLHEIYFKHIKMENTLNDIARIFQSYIDNYLIKLKNYQYYGNGWRGGLAGYLAYFSKILDK